MAKRRGNSIGQFISSTSIGQKAELMQADFQQKIITIFMSIFILFIISPWLTLAIKSKTIQIWIYSIFQFYKNHFIGEEEIVESNKYPRHNGEI